MPKGVYTLRALTTMPKVVHTLRALTTIPMSCPLNRMTMRRQTR